MGFDDVGPDYVRMGKDSTTNINGFFEAEMRK